ncbi:hypothetical protein BC629DRAFT_1443536 [Irpex lacteus]|nr:hypothetical protein BC629DRAFT_1443536 [Irpex lacteus]
MSTIGKAVKSVYHDNWLVHFLFAATWWGIGAPQEVLEVHGSDSESDTTKKQRVERLKAKTQARQQQVFQRRRKVIWMAGESLCDWCVKQKDFVPACYWPAEAAKGGTRRIACLACATINKQCTINNKPVTQMREGGHRRMKPSLVETHLVELVESADSTSAECSDADEELEASPFYEALSKAFKEREHSLSMIRLYSMQLHEVMDGWRREWDETRIRSEEKLVEDGDGDGEIVAGPSQLDDDS